MKKILGVLLAGLALGGAGGWFGHQHFAPRLAGNVEGEVVSVRREGERLVVRLRSDDRTMLATFSERVDDIEQILGEGDTVTLARPSGGGGVFADEPRILEVRRAEDIASEEGLPVAENEGEHGHARRRGHGEADAEPAEDGEAGEHAVADGEHREAHEEHGPVTEEEAQRAADEAADAARPEPRRRARRDDEADPHRATSGMASAEVVRRNH